MPMIEPQEFGDIAYAFMTGLPGWGSAGFCMMGPDELKRQRLTYVQYWSKRLRRDLSKIENARNKS